MPRSFVLVALLAALLGTALTGRGAHRALAQDATPSTALDVPGPEECRVAPRDAAALVSILATPTAATPEAPTVSSATDLPQGEPVDEATLAAISETTRQFVACINAGDTFRSLAVVTDGFLRQQLGGLTPTEEQLAALEEQLTVAAAASPIALEAASQGGLVEIGDVRRLADGRVGAVVVVGAAGAGTPPDTAFFVFLEADERWLVDEIVPLTASPVGTPVP
jgi:hypothetical protein